MDFFFKLKCYFDEGYDYGYHNGKMRFYMKDHLGSVRTIFKNDSWEEWDPTLVSQIAYDPYGNPEFLNGNESEGDMLYTGHFYHRPSGLYLAPYRAYDPKIGRWLSREPLGLDGPNLYHYGFNNPQNGIDPTGLQVVARFIPDAGYPASPDKANPGFNINGTGVSNPTPIYTGMLCFENNGNRELEIRCFTSGCKGSRGPLPEGGGWKISPLPEFPNEFQFTLNDGKTPDGLALLPKYRISGGPKGHGRTRLLIHPATLGGTLGCLGIPKRSDYEKLKELMDKQRSPIDLTVDPYPKIE